MTIETVRISLQGKEQLTRLKRSTKIENWNTLCRWAFCLSLAETTKPPTAIQKFDGGVEMSWKTFGGLYSEIYFALLKKRCIDDNIDPSIENMNEQLRLHLHRGLTFMSTAKNVNSITDLLEYAL